MLSQHACDPLLHSFSNLYSLINFAYIWSLQRLDLAFYPGLVCVRPALPYPALPCLPARPLQASATCTCTCTYDASHVLTFWTSGNSNFFYFASPHLVHMPTWSPIVVFSWYTQYMYSCLLLMWRTVGTCILIFIHTVGWGTGKSCSYQLQLQSLPQPYLKSLWVHLPSKSEKLRLAIHFTEVILAVPMYVDWKVWRTLCVCVCVFYLAYQTVRYVPRRPLTPMLPHFHKLNFVGVAWILPSINHLIIRLWIT